ncbi:MAG: TetR/AcrR family transcriptional regulator [Acidimicrobiales bacterium]
MATAARLGRPPATDSAETRARILDAARRKFAAHGFDSASNRALAEAAELTTGAIYHYFDSKLDIYVAVYEEATQRVYDRLEKAIVGRETFVARLEATLEESHQLNREDPTLALFLGTSRVDAARDPVLAEALRKVETTLRIDFFVDMIDLGVSTGEIKPKDRPLVTALVRTITVGLTDAVSHNLEAQRHAIDAINRLLAGTLIERV